MNYKNFDNLLNQMAISKHSLILMHYKSLNITDQEVIVILQIENIKSQNITVNPKRISGLIQMNSQSINNILTKLIDKNFLTISHVNNFINFSFDNLYYEILYRIHLKNNIINDLSLTLLFGHLENLLNRHLNDAEINKLNILFQNNSTAHEVLNHIKDNKNNGVLPKPFELEWLYNLDNVKSNNKKIDYNWLEDESDI